jgi:hypothetical protein
MRISFMSWNPSECDAPCVRHWHCYTPHFLETILGALLPWEILKQNVYCTIQYKITFLFEKDSLQARSVWVTLQKVTHIPRLDFLLMPQRGQRQVRKHFKDTWFINTVVTRPHVRSLLKIHISSLFIFSFVSVMLKCRTIHVVTLECSTPSKRYKGKVTYKSADVLFLTTQIISPSLISSPCTAGHAEWRFSW